MAEQSKAGNTPRFRILALDGGGIKGVFTASVLAELENKTGRKFGDHFDLVVGTSTGGIIAIGLGMGLSPQTIVDLYIGNATRIFGESGHLGGTVRAFRHLFLNKHSPKGLKAALSRHLAKKRLADSKLRLVIPTFDALKGHACTFKTPHHPRLDQDFDLPALDVALATSAAPTYFSAATITGRVGASYIDGGVWGNSPAMVGIVEAISLFDQPLDNIDVLSIGTTEEISNYSKKKRAGLIGWNKGLLEMMMAAQVTSAQAQAKLLIGDRLVRVNHVTGAGEYSLDDAKREKVQTLAELGRSVGRGSAIASLVKERFLNGIHAAAFHPLYNNSDVAL